MAAGDLSHDPKSENLPSKVGFLGTQSTPLGLPKHIALLGWSSLRADNLYITDARAVLKTVPGEEQNGWADST